MNCPTCGRKEPESKRFIVEGVWSGYHSGQQRVCHRQVIKEWLALKLKDIQSVRFTDNTDMTLTVRQAKPYEKVKEIKAYTAVLESLALQGEKG